MRPFSNSRHTCLASFGDGMRRGLFSSHSSCVDRVLDARIPV